MLQWFCKLCYKYSTNYVIMYSANYVIMYSANYIIMYSANYNVTSQCVICKSTMSAFVIILEHSYHDVGSAITVWESVEKLHPFWHATTLQCG